MNELVGNFPKYGALWRERVNQNQKVCMGAARLGNTGLNMTVNLRSVMSECRVPDVPGFRTGSFRYREARGAEGCYQLSCPTS